MKLISVIFVIIPVIFVIINYNKVEADADFDTFHNASIIYMYNDDTAKLNKLRKDFFELNEKYNQLKIDYKDLNEDYNKLRQFDNIKKEELDKFKKEVDIMIYSARNAANKFIREFDLMHNKTTIIGLMTILGLVLTSLMFCFRC
jgi:hypothetical protein